MYLVRVWLILGTVLVCNGKCPVWTAYNSSSHRCECGNSLNGAVLCEPDSLKVSLEECYCMTYNEDSNTTVVGTCVFTCLSGLRYETLGRVDAQELNQIMCGKFERTGRLCGKCVDNYSIPVYSYSQECTKCSRADFRHNLIKYLCVALLPLTAFYIIIVFFKVQLVSSGNMVGYILVCQLITSPTIVRAYLRSPHRQGVWSRIVATYLEIWNLDFFRSVYSPFCIHPRMTAMQVLALDYLVAVYPLFLIFLTYLAVSLHDRYPIVVKMWRPAYRVFSCIRKEWNIRGSLVQAFASFLVLSYVKILYTSFDLMRFVYLHDVNGRTLNQTYVYSDADVVYFGPEHLPYGILAITMLVIFNLLPMILLLLYPCGCFQRCLNRCGVRSQLLHTFMDAFQGCYRHQPRDCRYFAGIYLCVRIGLLLILSAVKNHTIFPLMSAYFSILMMVVLVCEPYKNSCYNKIDAFFLLSLSIASSFLAQKRLYIGIVASFMRFVASVISPIFLLYGVIVITHKFIPKKMASSVCACWQRTMYRKRGSSVKDVTLTDEFEQMDESTRLLT